MFFVLAYVILFAFWVSIAATEGWKWRQDIHRDDNNRLINYDSYHVWRGVTNVAPFLLCVAAFAFPAGVSLWVLIAWAISANAGLNIVYEMVMSYVQEDKWFIKRAPFHILKWTFERPPVWAQVSYGAACLLLSLVVIAC